MKQTVLPRWRGFNLLDMFTVKSVGDFLEDDFRWISDWGFDFVRIPACYTLWIENEEIGRFKESMLEKVDRVVRLGEKYGIHVCLNFHRAPGFSVNREREEPFNLWKDQAALDAFCLHWTMFTRRYLGIPSSRLSFNLVNEPMIPSAETMTREDHERVMRKAVSAIHAIDAERLIILDGLTWGTDPLPELTDLPVAQSCRAYAPSGVSHFKASWAGGENFPVPSWPGMMPDGENWDREKLESFYAPWIELTGKGIGVHCGEGGSFSYTPHNVVLAWYQDVLDILTNANIGHALWNFRGSFGILDSGRSDVDYEDWHGHLLDRQLLDILQSH